jgi:uncharacterized membrane protein YkoI
MIKKNTKIQRGCCSVLLIAASVLTLGHAAENKDNEAKELKLFNHAAISLMDAIKAAEHKTGGKAMEAEIDDEAKTVQYEVEIVKGGKIHKVIVDGKTGQVLIVKQDDEENEKD